MNLKFLAFLGMLIFDIFSILSNKAFAIGDDLVGSDLCGVMVDSGSDPCEFLREINLYSAVRHDEYNEVTKNSYEKIDDALKKWVIKNNEKYLMEKVNIYHKSKRAPLSKKYGSDSIINVYFWSVEIRNKNMVDIIFLSRSMHSHVVTSRQCVIGNEFDTCLENIVNNLLDKEISKKVLKAIP